VQFQGLAKTLPRVNFKTVLPLLPKLGVGALADWLRHYLSLGVYSSGYHLGKKLLDPAPDNYRLRRSLEALKYGSGNDFEKDIETAD
jgi:lycopene cyclase CruP